MAARQAITATPSCLAGFPGPVQSVLPAISAKLPFPFSHGGARLQSHSTDGYSRRRLPMSQVTGGDKFLMGLVVLAVISLVMYLVVR